MAETQYVLTQTKQGKKEWIPLPTGGVAAHNQAWSTITDTPTTLAGYGITDGGGSMTYPAAGIALSDGSQWLGSIVNNSANWNTAYGWGNHASAGYAVIGSSNNLLGASPIKIYGNSDADNYYIGHYAVTGSDGLQIQWYGGIRLSAASGLGVQVLQNGYVGIRKATPTVPFDVEGNTAINGTLTTTSTISNIVAGPGRYASFSENVNNIDENHENFITVGGYNATYGSPSVVGHHYNVGAGYGYLELLGGTRAIQWKTNGQVSINTGLHIGGTSEAGDNNLLVDGTGTVTGVLLCSTEIRCTGDIIAAYA